MLNVKMLFDIPYFDKLSKGYQVAVIKLDNDLKEAPNNRILFSNTLKKFVKTYTTITPIWSYWKNHGAHLNWFEKLAEQQLCHFYSFSLITDYGYLKKEFSQIPLNKKVCNDVYSNIIKARSKRSFRSIDEYKDIIQYSEEALRYPSECLKEIYLNYRITLGSFLSDEIKLRFQQSLKLLNKMRDAEEGVEKWIACLMKVENEDFIITNFEFRLEASPWCQQLWQFYIDYLRNINSKSILDVYSRYCRFFIDDIVGRESYRNEIERFEKEEKINVTKWWIDNILLESNNSDKRVCEILLRALSTQCPKSNGVIKFAEKFFQRIKPTNAEELKQSIEMAKHRVVKYYDNEQNILLNPVFDNEILYFNSDGIYFIADIPPSIEPTAPSITVGNFDTYLPQEFSFPKTICSYIFHNPNYLLRRKLFCTCKYFVIRYQTPICCNVVIKMSPNPEFYGQSIKIPESDIAVVKDFYVVNSLDAWKTENKLTLSNFCSSVYQFDLKFLRLHTQRITWKEFEFLTAPGNIESVYFVSVTVTHPDGREATTEEIIERFPNASRMLIYTLTRYSSETAQNLLKQKRHAKIEVLEFSAHYLGADCFCQFIQENAAPNAQVDIKFEDENVELDYVLSFQDKIKDLIETWEPQSERPKIDVINF